MFIIGRFLKSFINKIELNKQIRLLKKYNISNYVIENNRIIINGDISLDNIELHKILFKNTTINGSLYLDYIKEFDKDFFSNTVINGRLWLSALKECDKDFLSNTIILGDLNLWFLKSHHEDFLKNTVVNGNVYLSELKTIDKNQLRSNVKKYKEDGFNKEFSVLYLDGIISIVYSYYVKNNWVVYKTNNGTIHQRNIIKDNEIISKYY